MAKFVYDTRKSGMENLNRLFIDANIPEELLDEVEIVDAPKDSTASEFNSYTNKVGNTALKVKYSGELAELTGKTSNVHFYDRVLPIPDPWKNQVMLIQDTELKNVSLDTYLRDRFYRDGYPFVGETLGYQVEGTSGILNYGRNTVLITAPYRSYGLLGEARLTVQYLVDLNNKQTKVVALINPFLTQDLVVRKDGFSVLSSQVYATLAETKKHILDRYLKETYGISRTKAIKEELQANNIELVEETNFRHQLQTPANREQELEKRISEQYTGSYLYKFSQDIQETENNQVVGNIRLMMVKEHIGRLAADSGKYDLGVNEAYRFRSKGVRSFVFDRDNTKVAKIKMTLGEFDTADKAFEQAKEVIKLYFNPIPENYLNIQRDLVSGNTIEASVLPTSEISDYVTGEIAVEITYQQAGVRPPQPQNLVVKTNLNGFEGISLV